MKFKPENRAMAQVDRETILQNYLTQVMALQRARTEGVNPGDLRAVALELGMSEEDMAAADAAALSYLERGRGHLRHRLWGNAVEELTSAVALSPASTPALTALATAHKERWLADGLAEDRMRAEGYARRILELEPNNAAGYELLRELQNSSGPTLKTMSSASRGKLMVTIGIVVAVIMVIALVLLIWGARRDTGVL